jgi:hypothetical protein
MIDTRTTVNLPRIWKTKGTAQITEQGVRSSSRRQVG